MNTKSKFYCRLILAICAAIGSLFIIYEKTYAPDTVQDPVISEVMQNAPTVTRAIENDAFAVKGEPLQKKTEIDHGAFTFTNADAYDNIEWFKNRGYFSADEQEAYNNYDIPTLESMSRNGDMQATVALGGKYIQQGKTKKAVEYFWRAAALGSTAALGSLANVAIEPEYGLNETRKERSALRKAGALEALAILKAAAIRGDLYSATTDAKIIKNSFERLEKKPLALTEEELAIIDTRAIEIYKELQDKRDELGLGDFDNSTSKIVKEVYLKDNP